ncbi:MAG: response regulator, partial [Ruminococcus sp.]|nr:response regulator [Ruminococcus sp.]
MYKLIIIDDEPCFLESIVALFDWQLMNFELAATFTDSKKALQYLETNHVDAILTDIKMPKLSGLELARICHKTYPQIKIAFLTAYSDFDYAKAAVKYNVTDYILKATSFSEL